MATSYRVCKSTHRIAMVDTFPYGADYPFHAEIFEIRFHDNGVEMSPEPKCIGKLYSKHEGELKNTVRSFGLDWEEVPTFIEGLEVLVADYEERSKYVLRIDWGN